MIREIKIYPSKVLKQKAKPVGEIDAGLKKLIDDMIETLYAKKGAGLAANQIGELKRIFVFDAGEGPRVLINPKILRKRGKQIAFEGCLSLPGLELEIKRPQKIEVEYCVSEKKENPPAGEKFSPFGKIDEFEKKRLKAEGLAARVICHEIDHLDGKTILERLGLLKRISVRRRYLRGLKNKL